MAYLPLEIVKYPMEPDTISRDLNNMGGSCVGTIKRIGENQFTIVSSELEKEWQKDKAYDPPSED